MLGVTVAYLLGRSVGGRETTTLILAGVTVAAFFTAVQTYVQQSSSDTVQEVYSWILGQLETSGWTDVLIVLPYVAVSGLAHACVAPSIDSSIAAPALFAP